MKRKKEKITPQIQKNLLEKCESITYCMTFKGFLLFLFIYRVHSACSSLIHEHTYISQWYSHTYTNIYKKYTSFDFLRHTFLS